MTDRTHRKYQLENPDGTIIRSGITKRPLEVREGGASARREQAERPHPPSRRGHDRRASACVGEGQADRYASWREAQGEVKGSHVASQEVGCGSEHKTDVSVTDVAPCAWSPELKHASSAQQQKRRARCGAPDSRIKNSEVPEPGAQGGRRWAQERWNSVVTTYAQAFMAF